MSKDKAKPKAKPQTIKKGDAVKITEGGYVGKLGVVKHLRAATGEAHVELVDGGAVLNVQASTLEAA